MAFYRFRSRGVTSVVALSAALFGGAAWSDPVERIGAPVSGSFSGPQSEPQTAAPDPQAEPQRPSQVIVVTGTRSAGRSALDSAVPVDVLSQETIEAVSFSDTQDVLKTLVPSYTVARQPISDGATFIRPASLRGLSSDKTLVLVNSKRRHRAALVTIGGSGTQGPDVATIPATAIKTVEVLRDGAGAQYGSDAIAGVINFILKDAPEGGEIQFQAGQYYEEDGEDLLIAANLGLALGSAGFINFSVEGTSSQPTDRSEQWAVPANGGQSSFDVGDYVRANPQLAALFPGGGRFNTANVQLWGQPEASAFRSFVNAGYDLSATMRLYGFANYSNSQSDGDFNYRFPTNSVNDPPIRLQDGSLFRFRDRFPAGFTPRFFGNVVDYSATGGIKGSWANGLNYDVSARYGNNKIAYALRNTINPSLGDGSPDEFHPGDLISDELAFNADFSFPFETGMFASPLNVAFGAEYRDEGYELVAGDEPSYIGGPYSRPDPWGFCNGAVPTAAGAAVIARGSTLNCANRSDPVFQVNGVGANGFPGYPPEYVGAFNRDSYGVYVDLEADVTDTFFVNVAGRFESFSDFGEATDGKIAARWRILPDVALRASAGTGFRAPTPGQLSTTNVSTRFPAGEPVASGLFPATNPVSVFLGAKPLDPETSTNYSVGATASLGPIDVTLDLYSIEIADQFYASRSITVTNAIRTQLLAAAVPGADTIGAVQFFQNAFDSTTQGIDLVATYTADWGGAGRTNFTLSANYNTFEVDSIKIAGLFLEEDVFDFENGQPETRATFTVLHNVGPLTFMARANYYGEYTPSQCLAATAADGFSCTGGLIKQTLSAETLFDVEVSYDVSDATRIALGFRNVFDQYPDEGDFALRETSNGRIYRSDSIVDWQGGFTYLKAVHSF
ncbi:TonB-dependent receptor [bacterium]|nr:TonB-dependent receptor [bacterium]